MFPRWLSWLIVGCLGYLMISSGLFQHGAPVAPAPHVETPEQTYPALSQATDIERWKRAIDPDYAARAQCRLDLTKSALGLKVIEDAAGNGNEANCGETVTLHLAVWNARGAAAYEGTLPFAIGAREVAAGLDVALVAIKPGGTRTVILPPDAVFHIKKSTAPRALLAALPTGKMAVVTATRAK